MADRGVRRAGKVGGIALAAVLGIGLAACGNASSSVAAPKVGASLPSGGKSPGVTPTEIDVGTVATESGPLSTGFGDIVHGVEAYFSMVNAKGGVNGRKIVLKYNLDDGGSGSNDQTQIRNLVEQDKVFAIVGVGSPFFSGKTYLAQTGTPTFGYVVTDNWNGAPNLFGTYGSVLDYRADAGATPFVARQLKATKPAVVAYGYGPSKSPCQVQVSALTTYGPKPVFQDLNFGFGGDASADVQQMASDHVDLLSTCMEGNDNLSFVRGMHQHGMTGVHSIWLNGYSRSVISQNPTVMDGVIFGIQHVPFEAATQFPGTYPGMEQYLTMMKKYQPKWVYDDISFQGWVNAAQFVSGLRAIGKNVTQSRLVAAINQETRFTAGGIIPPVNWKHQHTSAPHPYCAAFVEAKNGKTKVVFNKGSEVFRCFSGASPTPVTPGPGTPGT